MGTHTCLQQEKNEAPKAWWRIVILCYAMYRTTSRKLVAFFVHVCTLCTWYIQNDDGGGDYDDLRLIIKQGQVERGGGAAEGRRKGGPPSHTLTCCWSLYLSIPTVVTCNISRSPCWVGSSRKHSSIILAHTLSPS